MQMPGMFSPTQGTSSIEQTTPAPPPTYISTQAILQIVSQISVHIANSSDMVIEFELDSSALKDSKFRGTKILIERSASAPKELNIRLTGSNEAVAAFNKNLDSLKTLFDKNNQSGFIIHRIETSHESPLFRRKEASGEKGEKGSSGGSGKQKR